MEVKHFVLESVQLTLEGIRAPYIHLCIFNHRISSMGLVTSNKASLHSP
jgi:hypothetical protein